MLKNISKLLSGELLQVLCDMGHGDILVIADGNYPAQTLGKRVVTCAGSSAVEILKAVVKVFPLDHIISEPILLMEVEPGDLALGMKEPEIWGEFQTIIKNEYGNEKRIRRVPRNTFYDLSKDAYCIIQTGEERLYGNLILTKGVVR
ncbi:MAG: fucose isomerase [Lachnospiraceae bacterium]|jgi:L-fucose mutarotase|nr:fucose isomerase [Lachnospiraceae bacterium]